MEETAFFDVPANFKTLVQDMTRDLSITFSEYTYLWESWTKSDITELEIKGLYDYCTSVYPERFFDILYQNEEIFVVGNDTNTLFLPGVEFKLLFNCTDITHKTRKSLWKYLQLILFTIVKNVKDKTKFGDSMSMFSDMENMDLYEKINETIVEMSDFFNGDHEEEPADFKESDFDGIKEAFDEMGNAFTEDTYARPDLNPNTTFHFDEADKPDAAKLHDHIKNLFSGKIGSLAQELAEEISQDIQKLLGDFGEIKSIQDLLKHAMKNPDKIIAVFKLVSDKLHAKLKSGDISQEELLNEVGEVVKNMKNMDNLKGLFDSIGEATSGSNNISDIIQKMMSAINGPGGVGNKGMANLLRIIKKFMATMGKKGDLMNMAKKMMGEDGAQQMEQFQDIFENMMGGDIPKGARVDAAAMERASQQMSLKERMRNRIIQKKLMQAQELAKEEAEKAERAKNYVPYDFSTEPATKNKVFRIEGETQETSSASANGSLTNPDKKKKKKNKNKK